MTNAVDNNPFAQAFEMAASQTLKAWNNTALLAMTRSGQVQRAAQAFDGGEVAELVHLLSEIAGPSYDGYAMRTGMDATRVMKLGVLIMRQICMGYPVPSSEAQRVFSVGWIHRRTKAWIAAGSLVDAPEELQRMSELMGNSPESRLSLVAPFAPALATCGIVFRAQESAYPFEAQSNKESKHGQPTE